MWLIKRFSTESIFIIFGLFSAFLMILHVSQMWLLPETINAENEESLVDIKAPIILWWASSFNEDEQYRNCGDKRCYFTKERSYLSSPLLRAILFYGSDFELKDLPVPRSKDVGWALLHEESPRNNPMFVHQRALELFNYSSTFSRYSDSPLTLLFLPGEEEIRSTTFFLPVDEKNQLMETKNLAPVLYIQTDCSTTIDRDSYVVELMKYIRVDSYGACLNNRRLPKSLSENYIDTIESEEFLTFVGQYKFTLAFENAVCDDYITEKLWRPLIVGSVPVYFGSPTFRDWLPNNQSAIAVEDFNGPKELADFLSQLNDDNERYEELLIHKTSISKASISNDRLLNELRTRPKGLESVFAHTIRKFECVVCDQVHNTLSTKRMTLRQYNCSYPRNVLPSKRNELNSWTYSWTLEKCNAKLLVKHIAEMRKIQIDEFRRTAFKMHENDECD